MAQFRFRLLWAAALATATLLPAGCAINPATGHPELVLMSEEQEIALGRQTHQQILKQVSLYNDPALADYVQSVGERVAAAGDRPELDYHFFVIDSPDVNAFALPGGYIYIYRGLLAYLETEAQLAAVLGHEIGHVTARHAVRQHRNAVLANTAGLAVALGTGSMAAADLSSIAGQAAISGYGRDLELEADRLGAEYMAGAGYDYEQMLKVLDILKYQQEYTAARARAEGREFHAYHGVFASHPENDERLQQVVRAAKDITPAKDAVIGRDSYLTHIDGLAYGYSREQGVVRDHHFYHADLDFAFAFPEGYRVENQPNALLLFAPGGAAAIQMVAVPREGRESPQALLQRLKAKGLTGTRAMTVHGHAAVIGRDAKGRLISAVNHGDRAYVFVGQGRNDSLPAGFAGDFESVITSFHSLTSVEADAARPWRIRLWRAKPGWDYARLGGLSPLGEDAADQLRLLNQDYPADQPQTGARIKLVE